MTGRHNDQGSAAALPEKAPSSGPGQGRAFRRLGFRVRVARRNKAPSERGSFLRLGIALALSLFCSALLLEVQGKPGAHGVSLLLQGGFGDLSALWAFLEDASLFQRVFGPLYWFFFDNYALADTLLKSIPIFLCSLGVAVCFHLQIWNIGAEGQFAMGAVGGTAVVLAFPGLPAWAMLPAMFLAAGLAGALWAAIPALLRQRLRTNEIISTLMFNYIAILFLQYLVYGPWKDPGGMGFPMTMSFPPAAVVSSLAGRIHWGLVLCVVLAVLLSLFLKRTRQGFELLAGGVNPKAARYAGVRYGVMVMAVMCLCGALAAWAGCLESSVTLGRLRPNITVGYGYTAIVVAWLARLRITRIALFSLLLAGFRVGTGNLELELQISAAFGDMIQGLILLMVLAGQFFDQYTFRLLRPQAAAPSAPPPSIEPEGAA